MSKPWRFAIAALLLLFTTTCTEPINIEVGAQEQRVVIFGRVTDGVAGSELSIAITSPGGTEQDPVSGARVSLIEDGEFLAEYTELNPGFYRLNFPKDSAREGRTYHVEIAFGGQTYQSKPAVMPGQAARDSVYFNQGIVEDVVNQAGITVERHLVEFLVDSEVIDPGKEFYLKWYLIEAYGFQERIRVTPRPRDPCFVTNEISGQEIRIFDGSDFGLPRIIGQPMKSVVADRRFAFDYYFSVIQTTMDADAHRYFQRLDEVSNSQGSIFDQAPAPVPGNITNMNDPSQEVLGYFEVVRSDTNRVRIRSNDLDFQVFLPCRPSEFEREPQECVNCLLIENSTHNRPYYWF